MSYESKFSRYMKNMGNTAFLNGNVRFWSVYIFFIKIFGSKIRTLFFLLIILIKVEKKTRSR